MVTKPRTALADTFDRPQLTWLLSGIGLLGGLLSGLLGVGGGVVMVPLMVFGAGLDQRTAHAMSLGAVLVISIGGIVTYGAAGKIDMPAALALTIGAVVGARLGANLLVRVDQRRLALAFSVILVLSGIALVAR